MTEPTEADVVGHDPDQSGDPDDADKGVEFPEGHDPSSYDVITDAELAGFL